MLSNMLGALPILIRFWKPLAIAGVIAVGYGWHLSEVRKARNEGFSAAIEEARANAGKRIIEMEKSNAQFRSLSARDRCRAFMRDSGLPEQHCD